MKSDHIVHVAQGGRATGLSLDELEEGQDDADEGRQEPDQEGQPFFY
ncbi:MAG TPA: hypothetical protein PKJ16_01740 [Spirochaetota bacterium]|nr:hypothetical protein [Spirochaetota bacterium]HPU89834.1 hypothetical protein [Spirochaetota bacterium]